MTNKKSIQVKGIKGLNKSEMESVKAAACGYIEEGLWIHCTDSFGIEVDQIAGIIIIGNEFTIS